MISFAFWH